MQAWRVIGYGRVTRSYFGQGALLVLLFQGNMLVGTPTVNQTTLALGKTVPSSIFSGQMLQKDFGTTYLVPPQGRLHMNWWYDA